MASVYSLDTTTSDAVSSITSIDEDCFSKSDCSSDISSGISSVSLDKPADALCKGLKPSEPTTFTKIHERGPRKLWPEIWSLELYSLLLASATLAGIVLVLVARDGWPLPKWPQLITINAVIATFTAIFKAAIALPVTQALGELKWLWFSSPRPLNDIECFDAATRGPWGALKLVWTRPQAIISVIGAIITVCALAIDPFTQQITQYRPCQIMSLDMAQVSRSNNYYVALEMNTGGYMLDGAMNSAVYQGLYNPPKNLTSSLTITCTSGNCTFPNEAGYSYNTVAMCTSVEDISTQIIANESNASDWAFSLPSGLQLLGVNGSGAIASTMSVEPPNTTDNTSIPLHTYEGLMLRSNAETVTSFAFRSSLYPCINSYGSVSMNFSVLTATLLSSTRLAYYGSNLYTYFSLAGPHPPYAGIDCSPATNVSENKSVRTIALSDGRYFGPDTSSSPDSGWFPYEYENMEAFYFDPACVYAFASPATYALRSALLNLFGTAVTITGGSPVNFTQTEAHEENNVVIISQNGPAWLQSMYSNGNVSLDGVTDVMNGFADALSVQMAKSGSGPNLTGITWQEQTCVQVKWAWLSLNWALLGLTAIFLLLTARKSSQAAAHERLADGCKDSERRAGFREPWKSSSLPLVWTGVDESFKQALQDGYFTLEDMEKLGKTMKVVLVQRGDGMGFTMVVNNDTTNS